MRDGLSDHEYLEQIQELYSTLAAIFPEADTLMSE